MAYFDFEDHRLAYTIYGQGNPVVLLHGQLLSQTMQEALAKSLAERGHRVITLDLLGHGASDRPDDMTLYSMAQFAEQVVALLDHLEVEQAVIGGTSLGANVALEFAALAPERADDPPLAFHRSAFARVAPRPVPVPLQAWGAGLDTWGLPGPRCPAMIGKRL